MSGPEDCELKSLHDAVESKNLDLLESLLKDGSDPNAVDDQGMTALNFICSFTKLIKIDLEMIQLLIQYGADVNIQDEDGNSPMMNLFCDESNDMRVRIEALKLLLKKGADVTRVNHMGRTIFKDIILCNPANPDTALALELLLKNGTDPNMIVDNEFNETALNFICYVSKLTRVHLKMIQILLQYNADVNTQDEDSYTPIINLFRFPKNYKLRLKVFKLLLENGADVTLVNHTGITILYIICHCNTANNPIILDAIELLLKIGIDVNVKNEYGHTALHAAVENCEHIKVIELLLKNGADPNIVDNNSWTALHLICSRHKLTRIHLKMIQFLIQYKADVNIKNKDGYSPIMSLFRGAKNFKLRLKVCQFLLENGVDVTLVDHEGNTVLHLIFKYSAKKNPIILEAVKLLIERGVDVNVRNGNGQSALHVAVKYCEDIKVIDLLLRNGADPNIVDDWDMTPLHYICKKEKLTMIHFKMIHILIQHKADVNIKDKDGYTPIMNSFLDTEDYNSRLKVFKLLLENGAVVQNVNNDGNTILHDMFFYSVKDPNIVGIVELLLQSGVDVNKQNENGHSALHVAVENCEHVKVIDLLLKNGADPNIVDNIGRTALHSIFCRTEWTEVHLEIIQLLIQYEADVINPNKYGDAPIMKLFFGTKDCNSRLEVFKLVAKYHVDDTSVDEFGRKMLPEMFESGIAISNIAKEVEFLLEIGVNVNILSKYGFSALHNAVDNLEVEQVEFLLKNGADPNITDVNGDIPLNYDFKSFDSIKLLRKLEKFFPILELNIEHNADISHCGGDGQTVLHSLIMNSSSFRYFLVYDDEEENHLERISKYVHQYVEVLLKHGLDVNVKNRDGFTALDLAVSYCNYDVAKILVEHGADVNTVQFKGGFFENKVPQSLNLLTTLNVLAIIELWQSKGFQINSYQYLRIFKFLTLFDDTKMNNDFLSSLNYVWRNTSVFIPSHQWIDIFECGSGSVIRKYDEALFLVINDSSNCTDFNIATLKIIVYTVIKLHLCLVEYGNMYMDIETYNYLQNKMNLLVSENPEIEEHYRKCRDKRHIDILDQVDLAKKMIISNNISFLDLCTSSPDKTYYLLQKCDYESAINSADFMRNFNKIGGIIRGYIIKALVRRLITQSTTDSMKLLFYGILPDLCCDKIIKFLDVIDLVSVYEAVVNYKC